MDDTRVFRKVAWRLLPILTITREGKVEIGVTQNGNELVYRVSDTGIGVPKEEVENVFKEFRQVDATVTREYGGTGLGLSIELLGDAQAQASTAVLAWA